MTADRLFTPPTIDEAGANAEQAKALLSYVADDRFFCTPYVDAQRVLYERDAATAMYGAQAATAHALLAVHADLARVVDVLQMLAKTPAAIDLLASHVTAESALLHAELRDTHAEVVDLRSSVEAGGDPIATAIGSVVAAVDGLARALEPRPRWWQFRLRRQQAAVADEAVTASQADPEVQPR